MSEEISKEEASVKDSIEKAKAGVKTTVREAKDTIKDKTKEVVSQAKDYGAEYVQQGKEQTAKQIGAVSESIRQTAERLEQEQDPNIARYTRLLADKLQNAANYVREHDLNQCRRDCEDLARQYPALFFGGLFVAGFTTARFLKASATREHGEDDSGPQDESSSSPATAMAQSATDSARQECEPGPSI